jgi:DNA helicase-2/ATP-dependent DNA helicase PcrA
MPVSRKTRASFSQLQLFGQATPSERPIRTVPTFELNERQREAVEHVGGPMLVVAGAGTGKTTVLTQRIARLIRDGKAKPEEILAVTYTENAAAELKQRVARELDTRRSDGLKPMTFHAYCFDILKRCRKDFGVVEKEDLWVYLRARLPELGLQYYTRAVRPAQFLDSLLDFFDNCLDELRTADDYESYVRELEAGKHELPRVTRGKDVNKISSEDVLARCREIARVFRKVEGMLERDGLGTFAHMILRAMQVLRSMPEVLQAEQKRARFLLIDEFQDSNIAQIELAQLLAGKDRNIFVLGDPDQAIYRFRGASSAAFEEFATRFPDTKSVVIDRNQRSTSAILNCSYAVVATNPSVDCRLGDSGRKFDRQPLLADRERRAKPDRKLLESEPVNLVMVDGNQDEAIDIASQISRLLQQSVYDDPPEGKNHPHCAVLYRSHLHRGEIVRELAARGVPFLVEGLNALETCEVRDLLACLCCLQTPADNDSLFRVAALPLFGIEGEPMRDALRAAGRDVQLSAVLGRLTGGKQILQTVENARAEAAAAEWKMSKLLNIVVQRFGIDSAAPPVVAFRRFVERWTHKATTTSKQLPEFLAYMKYFPEAGGSVVFEQPPVEDVSHTVALMTVHAAKGLEFDHVFVVRANAGSFPTGYREKLFEMPRALRDPRCLAPVEGPELHKQEERRLFYVAMTRARDSLSLYTKPRGTRNPRPAGFLRELIDAVVQRPAWRQRPAEARVELQAASAVTNNLSLGRWLLLAPSSRVVAGALSATAVEAYETCPLKFKIQRDWNIPGEIAASLHFGAAIHDALKDFFDAYCQGRPRTREQLLQIFQQALADRHFDDQHQRDLYRNQGLDQLEQFLESWGRGPLPQVFSTEKTFEVVIDRVRVRGRIDRMDRIEGERITIVDYKTGNPKNEIDARKSLQLSIYALAARELWNLIPERLVFYNVETAEEVVASRDEKELREARQRIADVAERIGAGDFEPTPGFHCRSCSYQAMCPATEERLYTIEQARAQTN